MAACTETGVQEDGVALVCIERTPGLVGDVELGQDTAPVKQDGLAAVVDLRLASGVAGFGT